MSNITGGGFSYGQAHSIPGNPMAEIQLQGMFSTQSIAHRSILYTCYKNVIIIVGNLHQLEKCDSNPVIHQIKPQLILQQHLNSLTSTPNNLS